METLIKLNSETAGRDKIARTVQYGSKLLWYELSQMKANIYLIERLQILEATCSSFRKLLRFGRCADSLYGALKSLRQPDAILRATLTLGKIANSLFLFADHVVWLCRAGFLRHVDSNRWLEISNKYWLLSIVMNIARDLYEIQKIVFGQSSLHKFKGELSRNPLRLSVYASAASETLAALGRCQDVVTDAVKNLCDLWIPLAGLKKVQLKPGTIGLLGTVSSLAALYAMLKPYAKLTPI